MRGKGRGKVSEPLCEVTGSCENSAENMGEVRVELKEDLLKPMLNERIGNAVDECVKDSVCCFDRDVMAVLSHVKFVESGMVGVELKVDKE